jgi:hypothetical protein
VSPERLEIIKELQIRGFDWKATLKETSQIVIFGSWSIGQQKKLSDIDILCVGHGDRRKTRLLDVIWRTEAEIGSPKWLGSELANHIASYGIWIQGRDNWGSKVFYSNQAIASKKQLIKSRLHAMRRLWKTLSIDYKQKHVVKLRRDIQRLYLMKSGLPVKPSPLLDYEWLRTKPSTRGLRRYLVQAKEFCLLKQEDLRILSRYLGLSDFRSEGALRALSTNKGRSVRSGRRGT